MAGEAKFWGRMRDHLSIDRLERVENRVGPGMPDVFFMHRGRCGWIELKAEVKTPSKIAYERGQSLWLADYWRQGGTAFTALFIRQSDEVFFWRGCDAPEIEKSGGIKRVSPCIMINNDAKGWAILSERWNDFRNCHYENL